MTTPQMPAPQRGEGGWWVPRLNPDGSAGWTWAPDQTTPPPPAWQQAPYPRTVQALPVVAAGPVLVAKKVRRWPWILATAFIAVVAVSIAVDADQKPSPAQAAPGAGQPPAPAPAAQPPVVGGVTQDHAPEPPPVPAPVQNGPSRSFPMQDGDWRLDRLTIEDPSTFSNDFDGRAFITYTGSNSHGGTNAFTITVFKDGQDVATLEGSASDVMPGQQKTVDLYSFDDFVAGELSYTFQNDW